MDLATRWLKVRKVDFFKIFRDVTKGLKKVWGVFKDDSKLKPPYSNTF